MRTIANPISYIDSNLAEGKILAANSALIKEDTSLAEGKTKAANSALIKDSSVRSIYFANISEEGPKARDWLRKHNDCELVAWAEHRVPDMRLDETHNRYRKSGWAGDWTPAALTDKAIIGDTHTRGTTGGTVLLRRLHERCTLEDDVLLVTEETKTLP